MSKPKKNGTNKGRVVSLADSKNSELSLIECESEVVSMTCENCGLGLDQLNQDHLTSDRVLCWKCKIESTLEELRCRLSLHEDKVNRVEERVARVEHRCAELGKEIETGAKKGLEVESQCMIVKLQTEDKIMKLGDRLDESMSRVAVLELRLSEGSKLWPTPSQSLEIQSKNKIRNEVKCKDDREKVDSEEEIVEISVSSQRASEISKIKNKGKVIVMGDSLAKGIGNSLERRSNEFEAQASPGAKIENITDKLKKFGEKPGNHLLLMVGTNNLVSDGSEILLDKYEKLLVEAKMQKYKSISMVSILDREDINEFYNSRRLGTNLRLPELCKKNGADFIQISRVNGMLGMDKLHLNFKGQDFVAREIIDYFSQKHLN